MSHCFTGEAEQEACLRHASREYWRGLLASGYSMGFVLVLWGNEKKKSENIKGRKLLIVSSHIQAQPSPVTSDLGVTVIER